MLAAGLQTAHAQDDPSRPPTWPSARGKRTVQTATIHWQDVPLRDAIGRLEKLFDESTFLDRRIDPTVRVNLDMSASSVEQVLTPIAAEHGWGVSRVGEVVYLGPAAAAEQLAASSRRGKHDVAKLPQRSERSLRESERSPGRD